MPGTRSDRTKLLGCYADIDLIARVDEVRGGVPRSFVVREAMVEYLIKRGVTVPDHLKDAPDRAGKGGPRPVQKGIRYPSMAALGAAGKLLKKQAPASGKGQK